MNLALKLLPFFLFSTYSFPIICLPDFCKLTKCPKLNCSEPNILQKGGFCSCCYVCFEVKDVGEYCGFPLYGLPPTTILCKEGLSCTGGFCLPKNEINVF